MTLGLSFYRDNKKRPTVQQMGPSILLRSQLLYFHSSFLLRIHIDLVLIDSSSISHGIPSCTHRSRNSGVVVSRSSCRAKFLASIIHYSTDSISWGSTGNGNVLKPVQPFLHVIRNQLAPYAMAIFSNISRTNPGWFSSLPDALLQHCKSCNISWFQRWIESQVLMF